MELYNVPRGSKVRLIEENILPDECVAPGSPKVKKGDIVHFDHVDGMYSFCRDLKGNIVHLKAWAEVEIVE